MARYGRPEPARHNNGDGQAGPGPWRTRPHLRNERGCLVKRDTFHSNTQVPRASVKSVYRYRDYDDGKERYNANDDYDDDDDDDGYEGGSSPSYRREDQQADEHRDVRRYDPYERPAADDCASECQGASRRVRMRKYCAMDYVYLVTVLGNEPTSGDGRWTGFKVQVNKRYRHTGKGRRFRRGHLTTLWVRTKHLRCRCPKIRPDSSYLILDQDGGGSDAEDAGAENLRGLVVKRKSMIIQWKKEWKRRMKRFKKRSKKAC